MPELPEVEITKQGITPYVIGQSIDRIDIHHRSLRYPVSDSLMLMEGAVITDVTRRAKYLMIHSDGFYLVIHLGMSGSLRISEMDEPRKKHDHIVFKLSNGKELRYHDPRRFGFVLLYPGDEIPAYMTKLAPEPLSDDFNHTYFKTIIQNKKQPIKSFIMDQKFVVGVGNIYANEALFMSEIHPEKPAQDLKPKEQKLLVESIKTVLSRAIGEGGTTLKDFVQPDGTHGYFAHSLSVYGRDKAECINCGMAIQKIVIAQRSTYFCPICQVLK